MKKMFVSGNEAAGWGAVNAGCTHFFGYPITPQNEIPTWFAREMPVRGRVFVQSQSEVASINLVFGASAAGARVMTSTSSPGWSLMLEGMSHLTYAELPAVIVLVQRGGPGAGTIRHAQMDYLSVTHGGGHGGYKTITLAPASVQEIHDLTQLAFYLSDKYRNPAVVLSDAILGQMMEPIESKTIDFGPLPAKDWALAGKSKHKSGEYQEVHCSQGVITPLKYLASIEKMDRKYREIAEKEVRYEAYRTEDAELILVSYGYLARVGKEVVDMARGEGLRIGMLRPVTLWPFPSRIIGEYAGRGVSFLVVEDSLGQMVDDVRLAVCGKSRVSFIGMLARNSGSDLGIILPERVLEEVRGLMKEESRNAS
jgi:2-oxoglutarate ferredoxin oxidoreductase subunit alpha